MNETEKEIVQRAAEAINAETGQQLRIVRGGARTIDAVVELNGIEYNAEVKKWVQQANFGALVYQVQNLPGRPLLIADYVNRKLAQRLKDAGIQFVDTAGNAYIKQEGLFINIRGNDPLTILTVKQRRNPPITMPLGVDEAIRPTQQKGTGRAFTPTGLKVVYELILQPNLISRPYREIAEKAGVALGTIGWVLNDLKAQGIVVDRGKDKHLRTLGTLIDAWAEAYPLRLRTKQMVGRFEVEDLLWFKTLDLTDLGAQWGGEIAGAQMTDYLKPAYATIYIRGDVAKFVQATRLTRRARTDQGANVELLRPFWLQDGPGDMVHPLVVYADLIATGDPRNLETARMIYDEYLDRHLE